MRIETGLETTEGDLAVLDAVRASIGVSRSVMLGMALDYWIQESTMCAEWQSAKALKAAKSAAAAQETLAGSESDESPPPEASTSSQELAPSVHVTETPDSIEPPSVPSVDSEAAQPSVHAGPSLRGGARQKKK